MDFQGLMQNPYVTTGLAIMAANKPGVSAGQAIGRGGLMGLAMVSEQKEKALKRGMMEEKRDFERQKLAQQMAAQQQAAQARAQMASMVPEQYQPWLAAGMEKEVFKRMHPEQKLPTGIMLDGSGNRVIDPLYDQMKMRHAGAGRSITSVNLPAGEKKYDEAIGTQMAGYVGDLYAASSKASERYSKSRTIEGLLRDVEGGQWGNIKYQAQKLLSGVGIETEGLAEQEVANKLRDELALSYREAGTGTMTEKDFAVLRGLPPSLADTQEGRKLIVEVLKRQADRANEITGVAEQYSDANGGRVDSKFRQFVNQYETNNPIFSDLPGVDPGQGQAPAGPAGPAKIQVGAGGVRRRSFNPETGQFADR